MEIKLKQYIFLPKSLNMSVGKAASQAAHSTFMALEKQESPRLITGDRILLEEWKKNGMCVIVLEAKDPEHLNNIAKYLDQWKVVNHLYIDEGLTEVPPMTPTALATGIISEDQFWMFNEFKLFGSEKDQIFNEMNFLGVDIKSLGTKNTYSFNIKGESTEAGIGFWNGFM